MAYLNVWRTIPLCQRLVLAKFNFFLLIFNFNVGRTERRVKEHIAADKSEVIKLFVRSAATRSHTVRHVTIDAR